MKRKQILPFIVGVCFLPEAPVVAEPSWPIAPYNYVVVDQDLRAVLRQFAANTGLRLVLSDKVRGRVHGPLSSASSRDFFDMLVRQFGLDWTYDGAIIWVSTAAESQTNMLSLQGVSFARLRQALATAGLLDPRFQLRAPPGSDIAIVSGPPHYIALVQQALAALAGGKAPAERPASHKSLALIRGDVVSTVDFPYFP